MFTAARLAQESNAHALWIARAMARNDLSPLAPEDLPRLEAICAPRSVRVGSLLMRSGEDADRVFVVREGEVQLLARLRPVGRHVVGLVRAGGVIGDIPMLCGKPMPFDAVVARDGVVLELERGRLVELLRTSPTLSLRWTTSVARRMEENQRRILAMLTLDLAGQVATILLDEREPGPSDLVVVRLSHAVIAQLLGARRQSVSRVMRDLRRRGLVGTGYRETALLDLDRLAALAGRPVVSPPCGQGAATRPAPVLAG